ncbi:MAG TPA: permease prefix domain 1-containing protein [Pseudonocardiaceae bacterium]
MDDKLIHDYLSALAAGLPGSARARAAIVTEIGDGLADAVADHLDHGHSPDAAHRMAVEEFGDPEALAAQFTPVVAATQVHRCGLALLRTGPLVGVLWLTTVMLAGPGPVPVMVVLAGIVVALAVLTAVPCAVFAVAVTGRGSRRWTVHPRSAADAVVVAASGAVLGDLVLLSALATLAPTVFAAHTVTAVVAGFAVVASLIRLTLAARNAGQLRHTRTALTSR